MNQYKPMLAKEGQTPFNSKDWIFEIKWDGIRAISYINKPLSIRSRNDKELKHYFPELEELKTLGENIVLDGEIIVMNNGKPDFQKLLERSRTPSDRDTTYLANSSRATYIVFDILEKDDVSLIELPLVERKELLKKYLKEGRSVLLSIFVEEDGEAYYEAALQRGLEGIIAKKKDSPYEPGIRSSNWLKIKKLRSCDCAVLGYTLGEGARKSLGALILALYDKGKPIYVGKVGTGFTTRDLELLHETFKGLESDEETLSMVDVPQQVVWLRPKIVCEVVYQNVTEDRKLRLPRFRGLRFDKSPQECTFSQVKEVILLKYTSKRDFTATPEPPGTNSKGEGRKFVVQEHHARRLHYDLRLERDGTLKNWAVPKGIPLKQSEKRLAVETEDHPLEYSRFEGVIPKGQYGAGAVEIWDTGSFELKLWEKDKIEFSLKGKKLVGKYLLTRLKKAGEKDWLLLRVGDPDD
ncbi:MAG: Multifunctional non-ous end joining protein LigD [Thermoproteota archaeon]|nr:Multifunctional non-ous end joining protein LigD [Thermoproteota archaeon]